MIDPIIFLNSRPECKWCCTVESFIVGENRSTYGSGEIYCSSYAEKIASLFFFFSCAKNNKNKSRTTFTLAHAV